MTIIQYETFFFKSCFKCDWWNQVQLNSRIPLLHDQYDAEILVKVTWANNFLPLACAWQTRERVHKVGWSGETSSHKAKQNITGTSESYNWAWTIAPRRWWQPFLICQEALGQTFCITWQNSARLCRQVEFLVPRLAQAGMSFQRLC